MITIRVYGDCDRAALHRALVEAGPADLRLLYHHRQHACRLLRSNEGTYSLADYFHCLHFTFLTALRHDAVREKEHRRRRCVPGAALTLDALHRRRGRDRLASPCREIRKLKRGT